jgi:3' exoribonuclease, RNase T-like
VRIHYDTEFLEDGRTIDLISIGIVAGDGREYYAVNSDADWERIKQDDWLVRNVMPSLPVTSRALLNAYLANPPNRYPRPLIGLVGIDMTRTEVKPRQVIANEVRDFILGTDPEQLPHVELWADWGAYDHVALCQLWGRMVDLPEGIPMWTHDLRQELERRGAAKEVPSLPGSTEHNALHDAREVKFRLDWLTANKEAA